MRGLGMVQQHLNVRFSWYERLFKTQNKSEIFAHYWFLNASIFMHSCPFVEILVG